MNSVSISSTLRSRRAWFVLQLSAGILVGAVTFVWAVRGLDVRAVGSALANAHYAWVGAAFLCTVAVAFVKVARWRALYAIGDQPVPFDAAFSALLITQMINVIIPVRVGELIRIGLMKQSGQPGAATLSTIAVEKALDLVAAGLAAASLAALAVAPDWLRQWSGSVLVLGFVLVAGLVAVWWVREPLARLAERGLAFGGWLPEHWRVRLVRIARTMLDAFGVLTTWRSLVRVLVWTSIAWGLSPLTMIMLFAAFGLSLPFAAAIVLMLAITFSNIVPSPPALVGVVQAIAVAVLGAYGVNQSVALGLGIVLNVVTVAPLILLGTLALCQRTVFSVKWLADRSRREYPGKMQMENVFSEMTEAHREDAAHFDAHWQRIFAEGKIALMVPPDEEIWKLDLGQARQKAFEWLGDLRGKSVLELGCGPGTETIMMARCGAHVTALDIAPSSLRITCQRARINQVDSAVDVSWMAAEQLAFPPETFDWVVGFGVLHHVDPIVLGPEVQRVLRRNGRALFFEPLGTNPALEFARKYLPYRGKHHSQNEHPLRYDQIGLVGKSFRRTRVREFYLFSMISRAIGSELSFPALWALDEWLIQNVSAVRRWCRYVLVEYVT